MMRIMWWAVAALCAGAVVVAQQPPAAGQTAVAQGAIAGRVLDAESGAAVPGVTVGLSGPPGRAIRPRQVLTDADGRFVFLTLPDGPPSLRIALTPVPTIAGALLAPAPVTPQGDGTFALTGVAPGRYRVAVTGGGAWSLRSAILNGRDTLDSLLDVSPAQSINDLVVTITDRPTEVSGTLFDHAGKPAPGYAIVIFSTDREHWTTAPRRLSGVVRLRKIVLSEGERKVQDLRIGG